jgi:hypothetical protein
VGYFIVFIDKDVSYSRAKANLSFSTKEKLELASIKIEIRSPNTPAQREGAKRARDIIIIIITRVIRIYTSLPKALVNKLIYTIIRLLNVTLIKALR